MRRISWITIFILALVFLTAGAVVAGDKGVFSTVPHDNNGKKWRIGYYEGGEYDNYQEILIATIKGLIWEGWIDPIHIPLQRGEQTTELWKWLSTQAKSNYIEFVKDAHYTANWDDKVRVETAGAVIKRLSGKKDIDLIIAMGTWAGQDLASIKHSVPTIVMGAIDPVGAAIIKSVEDSGFDHVHARVDPFRYERQLRVFHDVVGFKILGIAYEDTVSGRSIAAIDKIEKVAKSVGRGL